MLSKNHAARLKRVRDRLDRSLDSLMQANGELWPKELRHFGEPLQKAVIVLQGLSTDINAQLSGGESDGVQLDIENAIAGETTETPAEEPEAEEPEAEEPPPAGSPASRRRRAS